MIESVTVTTIRSATTTTLRAPRVRGGSPSTAAPSTTTPPDTTAPVITSFSSTTSSPVAAGGTAIYTLVFDEDVTGVAPNDFANNGTADFCSFATAGTAQNWTVTVTGCVGGTIRPWFNANGATDLVGNPGPSAPRVADTTLTAAADSSPPSVTSFESDDGPTVDAFEPVVYTITFSERVGGVSLADFSNAGTARGCTFSGAGNGVTWTMTVSGCANGTIIPRFAADGAVDTSSNTGPATAATATTTITAGDEAVPPTVLGFSSLSISPTALDIVYTITFSEDVDGVGAGDFTNIGTASGCVFSVSGSGSTRTLTASECRRGTVIPRLAANSIEDLSDNDGPTSPATATVTIFALPEADPPVVLSFVSAGGDRSIAEGTSVVYTLTFDEDVNGVTPSDFTNSGTAAGCTFLPAGSGTVRSVTVSGCVGGTLIPVFAANGAFDVANNIGPVEAFTATTIITAGGTAPTTTVPSAYPPESTVADTTSTTSTSSTSTTVRSVTTTTLRPVRIRIR